MYLNELVLEITRRCNARCQHCLRGAPQQIDMSYETIDRVLEGVEHISTITFSGGEPSLAVDRIRYFLKAIKARKISLGGFFMYTNGKKASLELVHALLDLYAYIHPMERAETCSLIISEDRYHTDVIDSKEAIDLYSGLTFFHRQGDKKIFSVIAEGRAKDWGDRQVDLNDLVIGVDNEGNVTQDEGTLYVNALGDVISSCNLSYVSQKKNKLGNVHEKPIAEILRPLADVPSDTNQDAIINHNDELKEAA